MVKNSGQKLAEMLFYQHLRTFVIELVVLRNTTQYISVRFVE